MMEWWVYPKKTSKAHTLIRDDAAFPPSVSSPWLHDEPIKVVPKSEYIKVCEENERLMNVEYWPERCRAAEDELKSIKLRYSMIEADAGKS